MTSSLRDSHSLFDQNGPVTTLVQGMMSLVKSFSYERKNKLYQKIAGHGGIPLTPWALLGQGIR